VCVEVQHKAVDLVKKKWNGNVMLCSLVHGYQMFAGNHCLHFQIREVKHVSEKMYVSTYIKLCNITCL